MLRMVLKRTAGSRTPGTPHLRVKLGIREILLNGYDAVRRGPDGLSAPDVVSYLKKSLK